MEPEDNPTGVIYGTITAGALLAAESTRHETSWEAALATAITLVLFWAAHSYSAALGDRLEGGATEWSARYLFGIAAHEVALLKGAVIPLVVLLIAWAGGVGPEDAVTAALVAAVVLLIVLEIIAALRSRLGAVAIGVQMLVSGAIGIGVLLLKVAFG